MALDRDKVDKPARKLRRLLKKVPASATPDQVHDLRTNSRKLEAMLHVCGLSSDPNSRRVLKGIARFRKRAGKIRDMDVLTDYLSSISGPVDEAERSCATESLEKLGATRYKQSRKLHRSAARHASSLRKDLKKTRQKLANELTASRKADGGAFAAAALHLTSELRKPARLGKSNLHAYRLKVKELRNLLQMASDSDQQKFVASLGEVKDAIGEWHDWETLLAMAKDNHEAGEICDLQRKLREICGHKYEKALGITESVRKQFLGIRKGRSKSQRSPQVARAVWSATSALAS